MKFHRIVNSYLRISKRFNCTSNSELGKRCNEWCEPEGFDSGISIYNTANKKKVKFKTKVKGVVSWYACGPTVYDSAHIGHACCYVYQDIIRRIMEDVFNLKVMMVLGITDIDDKIIAAAASSSKESSALAQHFETEFFVDMAKLNVRPPSITARVTDYIPHIVNFIDELIKKDFGYSTPDGSVYFRVDKFKGYGKLHPAETDPTESVKEVKKESRKDFALWKGVKQGEPSWAAPWGHGRPGWHIECSTIASCLLGKEIDLHSGGVDLIFPHHENEEAQSCCYHSVNQWVNYWIHTGHLRLSDDVKMSKSLKNTISISDFLTKYSSFELRMFCLLTRYRNGIEYADKFMLNAVALCKRFDNFFNDCDAYIAGTNALGEVDEPLLLKCLYDTESSVMESLSNDFDTPRAISHLLHLSSVTNKMMKKNHTTSSIMKRHVVAVAVVRDYIRSLLNTFGYSTEKQDAGVSDVRTVLDLSVLFRSQIRKTALGISKDQPKEALNLKKQLLNYCDIYRNDMLTNGVELKDRSESTSWSLVKKLNS